VGCFGLALANQSVEISTNIMHLHGVELALFSKLGIGLSGTLVTATFTTVI
jgi:hypothetical protein